MNALEAIHNLIRFLDVEAKKELASVDKAYRLIRNNKSLLTRERLDALLDQVTDKLHDEGYFVTAKWRPATKTTKMTDIAKKLEA